MTTKNIIRFLIKNYPITIFILIVLLISAVAFIKLFAPPKTVVYAKVYVGQGLWWAATQKPSIWLAKSIKIGDAEYGLLGNKNAEVVAVKYYPITEKNEIDQDKFNVYITVKLTASFNAKEGSFTFNRAIVSVGSPIEINTASIKITGSIMEISKEPFKDTYEDKIVTLTKKFAYPWEYNALKVGDTYNNGEENVFELLSKYQTRTALLEPDSYGNFTPSTLDSTRYIVITAKMKLLKKGDYLFWNEDKIMKKGTLISLSTSDFEYQNFAVADIR